MKKANVLRAALLACVAWFWLGAGVACAVGQNEDEGQQADSTTVTKSVVVNAADLQNVFAEVADEVLPVVVEVNVLQIVEQQQTSLFGNLFGGQQSQPREVPGLGSGVIVRADGETKYVMTNYHVVQDADRISIVLSDGRSYEAEMVGGDQRTDLALIKFSSSSDIPVATIGDSDLMHVGHWVLAVGNPYGFQSTVTAGIVSALGRNAQPGTPIGGFSEYIQTDASINPGNSGGALVNLDGEVIGINSWIASQSGSSAGIGFAIPSNVVRSAIDDFIKDGRIIYGWLGITYLDPTVQPLDPLTEALEVGDRSGVLIDNIHVGSPAYQDELRPGDFIVGIDGEAIGSGMDFARAIGGRRPDTEVTFDIVRYGGEISRTVRLAERPESEALSDPSKLWPGIDIMPITDEVRDQTGIPSSVSGVIAIRAIADSPVAVAGIVRGDVIQAVNDTETNDPMAFYRALNEAANVVTFEVNRGGRIVGLRVRR